MKEKDMINPNRLGYYHRDIIKATPISQWHMRITLSCGHVKDISKVFYRKYKDDATLCITCSHINEE